MVAKNRARWCKVNSCTNWNWNSSCFSATSAGTHFCLLPRAACLGLWDGVPITWVPLFLQGHSPIAIYSRPANNFYFTPFSTILNIGASLLIGSVPLRGYASMLLPPHLLFYHNKRLRIYIDRTNELCKYLIKCDSFFLLQESYSQLCSQLF